MSMQEVIFREYDMTTGKKTICYIETEEEIDIVQCVIELWLAENQKRCMEGIAENVLCGI